MKLLALDLGTNTGWSCYTDGKSTSGSQNFSTKRTEGAGMRYLRFRRWLESHKNISEVYYEEVKRHAGTQAAHVFGALEGVVMAWCEENQIPYSSVPVGSIKRGWTGKGNASKQEMIDVAKQRGVTVIDDNQVDALALLEYVLINYHNQEQ